MLFKLRVVQSSEPLQKKGGIELKDAATARETLLLDSGVYGSGFDEQQYIVLLSAGEHCTIDVSSARSPSHAS